MKQFLLISFAFFSLQIFSQGTPVFSNGKFNPCASISIFNNTFNSKDYYYGFSMGIEDLGYEWGARFNFQFRPFFKRTLIQDSPNLIRQYREKKYFISVDLDKRFLNLDFSGVKTQLFIGTQVGFLLGNYRATRISAPALFNVVPVGGVSFNFKYNNFLKIGYCYLRDNLIEVPDGKVVVNFVFTLKEPDNQDIKFNQQ